MPTLKLGARAKKVMLRSSNIEKPSSEKAVLKSLLNATRLWVQ
jgi:hypothetical protein